MTDVTATDTANAAFAFILTVKSLFTAAGFVVADVKAFPNQYSKSLPTPWLHVLTDAGVIEVGLRRQTIYLDWNLAPGIVADAFVLFHAEDTTRTTTSIHAHGHDKLAKYVRALAGCRRPSDAPETRTARIATIRSLRQQRLDLEERFRERVEVLAREQKAVASLCDHTLPNGTSAVLETAFRLFQCVICDDVVTESEHKPASPCFVTRNG